MHGATVRFRGSSLLRNVESVLSVCGNGKNCLCYVVGINYSNNSQVVIAFVVPSERFT